jgi:hypothetical protein
MVDLLAVLCLGKPDRVLGIGVGLDSDALSGFVRIPAGRRAGEFP